MIKLDYKIINELAEKYGNAFYIVDIEKLKSDIKAFNDSFQAEFKSFAIAYSFKTCFLSAVLKTVKECGCKAEVTSEYEYALAKAIGFSDSEMVFNGPYKLMKIAADIIQNGGIVNIDSLFEANKICSYFAENNLQCGNIGIRCNFSIEDNHSRFGIDLESDDVEKAVLMLESFGFRVNCLHCHLKAKTVGQWEKKVEFFCSKINELKRKGVLSNLETIDFGGGYHYNESAFYASLISRTMKKYELSDITVITEPGAAIAEGSMLFASRIINVNSAGNRKYAVFAGCTEDVSAIRRKPPASVEHFSNCEREEKSVSLCGCTCLEDDIICSYPYDLQANDFIVFYNTGAYASALRSNFIRSHPCVLVFENGFRLSREEGSLDYYLTSSGLI